MDSTIVALATTAATTVVQAMAGDLWKGTRDQFAALFGPKKDLVTAELDASREDVLHNQELAQAVEEEWRGKLVRFRDYGGQWWEGRKSGARKLPT